MDNYLMELEITTKVGCYNNCSYCPQLKFITAYNHLSSETEMTLDTFKSIISNIPPKTKLYFAGMCEPFLNPYCIDMINYATSMGNKITLYTTLIGLDTKRVKELINNNIDPFVIHIPNVDDSSYFNSKENEWLLNINEILRFKKPLFVSVGTKTISNNITKFLKSKGCQITSHPILHRAGNLDDSIVEIKGRISCKKFKDPKPVVLPNGSVILCCVDYSIMHVLGNLKTQTFSEILTSPEMLNILKALSDDTIPLLCRKCQTVVKV